MQQICEDEDNEILVKIAYGMAYLTHPRDCWIIGSGALFLASRGLKTSPYKNIKKYAIIDGQKISFQARDIDFLVSPTGYDILKRELLQLGVLTKTHSIPTDDYSILFKTNSIRRVERYVWTFDVSHLYQETIRSYYLATFCNIKHRKMSLNIDIIVSKEKSLEQTVSKWRISDLKRNFGIYCDNRERKFVFRELNKNYPRCLIMETVGNYIETIKTYLHHNANSIENITKTGDTYILHNYDRQIVADNGFLEPNGIYNQLNFLLSGHSMRLSELINLEKLFLENKELLKDDDSDCAICQTKMCRYHSIIKLSCGHLFCATCILNHILRYLIMILNRINKISYTNDEYASGNFCPLCKQQIMEFDAKNDRIYINPVLDIEDRQIHFCGIDGKK